MKLSGIQSHQQAFKSLDVRSLQRAGEYVLPEVTKATESAVVQDIAKNANIIISSAEKDSIDIIMKRGSGKVDCHFLTKGGANSSGDLAKDIEDKIHEMYRLFGVVGNCMTKNTRV